MRHELCHCDDAAFKKSLLIKAPDSQRFINFESNFSTSIISLWDEYYANRYSFGPSTDPKMFFELLRDTVADIREQLNVAILGYRTSHDLPMLLAFAVPKIRFVAQCFGYAAGTLAAMGATLADEAPAEHAMLERLGLLSAWDLCFDALLELDQRRASWDSILSSGN